MEGYGTLYYNQGWTGLLGLLASPGKGLIIYFPVVIVFPMTMKYIYRKDRGFFIIYILLLLLATVILQDTRSQQRFTYLERGYSMGATVFDTFTTLYYHTSLERCLSDLDLVKPSGHIL